jgi:hypothetical protein
MRIGDKVVLKKGIKIDKLYDNILMMKGMKFKEGKVIMISPTGNVLVNIGNNDNRFYSKCMLNLDT